MRANFKRPLKNLARKLVSERRYMALQQAHTAYRKELWPDADIHLAESRNRLLDLKSKHKGERCFIIGNGPSLKKSNLSHLETEYTFGLNRIYLLFDELGFTTTYLVSVNQLVIEQFAAEIEELPCMKFISWSGRDAIEFTEDVIFLQPRPITAFFRNLTEGIWTGGTVTYAAMQIAYYLGFEMVILVGVDHSFATKGQPHKTVISQGDDPNHFDPSYFGKGVKWQLPDLERSELAFGLAKYEFEQVGREIVDATVGGKLDIFRKVEYEGLF